MDREAWRAAIHGVTKSWTRLSDWTELNWLRLVIAFLPRSEHLVMSWLQSPSAVILELKKIKSVTVFFDSPSICHEVMGPDAMILVFWMLTFKPTFSLSSFTFISSVQFSSVTHWVWLFVTPWIAACQAPLSITNSQSPLKPMPIKSVMPSNHLILCHPLLLLPSIFPSIRVFSNESVLCIRWPKYWRFSISISPSNEYSGLISFRIDWFVLLAVQGTLKSFLQHHSSKTSILQCSAFFYGPTLTSIHNYWKNHSFD